MKNFGETEAILSKAFDAGIIENLNSSVPGTVAEVEFFVKGKKIIMNFFHSKLSKVTELVGDRVVRTTDYARTRLDTLVPILTTRYGDNRIATREFRELDKTKPGVLKLAKVEYNVDTGQRVTPITKQYILNGQVVSGRNPVFFGFGSI